MSLPNDGRFSERPTRTGPIVSPIDAQLNQLFAQTDIAGNVARSMNLPNVNTAPTMQVSVLPSSVQEMRQAATGQPISADTPTGLRALPGYGQSLPTGNGAFSTVRIFEQSTGAYVNFSVSPEISESKSVNYIEISEIRQAASILVFIASPGRNFTVNAKLVSRSEAEAAQNFSRLNLMKSWSMPDKQGGSRVSGSPSSRSIDTSAPTILYIYGYGQLLKGIQVVMKSINIEYPTDVDYVPVAGDPKTKMPIIMPVSMTFQEIRSAEELQQFDLNAYKLGQLEHW